MRISSILVIVSLVILQSACQQEPAKTTRSGYPLKIHVDYQGEQPETGDMVYYHVQHRKGDQVTFSSRVSQDRPNMLMLPDFATLSNPPSPIMDALRELSEGDSATVLFPLDTVAFRPKGYENADAIAYDIVVTRIDKSEEVIRREMGGDLGGEVKSVTPIYNDEQAGTDEEPLSEEERKALWNKSVRAQIAQAMDAFVTEFNGGRLDSRLQTTDDGLKYMSLQEGKGPKAKPGDKVTVHYFATLTSGKEYDSTFKDGEPHTYTLGRGEIIPGWEKVLQMMNENSNMLAFIPAHLGYGAQGWPEGEVPPNAELAVYFSLVKIGD